MSKKTAGLYYTFVRKRGSEEPSKPTRSWIKINTTLYGKYKRGCVVDLVGVDHLFRVEYTISILHETRKA